MASQRVRGHVGDHQRQDEIITASHLKDDQDRRDRRANDSGKDCTHSHESERTQFISAVMEERVVEVTKDAAQGSTYEERRRKYSAGATATVREHGCDQLEDAENQERSKCQTAGQREGESSISSSGDTIGSEPVDRGSGESSSDESADSGPRPGRQQSHSLKAFSQNEKRVGESQGDDGGSHTQHWHRRSSDEKCSSP